MRIKTERLTLRPLCMADLEATHAYASDLENTRYMVFLPNETREETERFIREAEAQWRSDAPERLEFAILREGGQIGGMTLFFLGESAAELGWILDKRHWGQGYALEAARGLIESARGQWGIRRFIAQCDSENEASWRLMERLGMRRVGCEGGRKNRSTNEERQELTYEIVYDA